MTSSEAEGEQVDIRKKWPHEALDFTPWLACNLDLLGEEIGLELELVQQEKQVGPLYLDILARDAASGRLVAIENQLEWADLHHLGQLLTYATGCDAHVAIWVAPGFTYEYAQTLNRLNKWTKKEFDFYGVAIEVRKRTDDSSLEPRFRKVVYPDGWEEKRTPHEDRMHQEKQRYHDFFQPLITKLTRPGGFADKALYHFGYTGRRFRSRIEPSVWYTVTVTRDEGAWVTLYIGSESKDVKPIFDALQECQAQIESDIGAGPLCWERRRHYFSSIYILRNGCSIDDSQEKLEETRKWMCDILFKFKRVFDPRVETILDRLSP